MVPELEYDGFVLGETDGTCYPTCSCSGPSGSNHAAPLAESPAVGVSGTLPHLQTCPFPTLLFERSQVADSPSDNAIV